MQLLSHEDPNVRYEALVAVQKLMVHNWYVLHKITFSGHNSYEFAFHCREYLGKQLEKENEGNKPTNGAGSNVGGAAIQGKA